MTKTFLKTTYIAFLWIILFANILFAFDLVGIATIDATLANANIDYSTKYFGISTIIKFFQNLNGYVGVSSSELFNHYNEISSLAAKAFNEGLIGDNNISNDFFHAIVDVLTNIANTISGIGLYIYSFLVLAVCWCYVAITLFFAFIKLISGYHYETLPSTAQQLSELILIL